MLYRFIRFYLGMFYSNISMALSKSLTSSALITFLRSKAVSSSFVKKTPGESISYTLESRSINYRFLVWPGCEETDAPFLLIKEFIMELFPTFG